MARCELDFASSLTSWVAGLDAQSDWTAKHNNAKHPRSQAADSDRKAMWQVLHESYRRAS